MQITENTTTLSPLLATLTRFALVSPFAATLSKNTGGTRSLQSPSACRTRRYTRPQMCIASFTRAAGLISAAIALSSASATAQSSSPTHPATSSAPSSHMIEQAIDLAAKGACEEALPTLRRSGSHIADKELRYRAAMATAKCAMSLDERDVALQALSLLNHDFPNDPEVLYISTHYYSELGNRAAQHLAASAPDSYQARELEAEAMESQGKWDAAATEYKKILDQDPKVPGIHFRLGRVVLSKSDSPESGQEAKKEFEAELQLDPSNAASEFWLGEIARRAGQFNDALPHFTKASKLDTGFAEAYLALGMTLSSLQQFAQAVAPLERYVKIVPADPAGHYQLAIAYARTDRKSEADREMSIQRKLAEKNPNAAASPPGSALEQ